MSAHAGDKFYVTTPIYYATAKPHLGTLYSTVIADVLKRWHMMRGKRTFMLTGTDEHGQKIAQAAAQAGLTPQRFVDGFIADYKTMWSRYEIEYDHFMRTTDVTHVHAVQAWIRQLQQQGDIYKDSYSGWYCTPCETFVTEKDTGEAQVGSSPTCPSCGRATVTVEEECYFFRLSAYQDKLLAFYKSHPDFILPKERMAEVIRFVEGGLKDLSISRTTITWGIPFPDDPKHVTYVWADALNNYLTAVGYAQEERASDFTYWWPADIQVLGKDIVRFHAVYWPAFLMAAGVAMPRHLLVHGWIKVGDQKMSKSLGNAVDPDLLQQTYGADPVRFYLMRYLAMNQDGRFAQEDLEQAIASDLANDLGNLLSRTVALAHKYQCQDIVAPATWSPTALVLRGACWDAMSAMIEHMHECQFHLALARLWAFIRETNAYFHEQEPWKKAKEDQAVFLEVIAATCHALYAMGIALWPVMPRKMEELLHVLGCSLPTDGEDLLGHLASDAWRRRFLVQQTAPLFVKPEPRSESTSAVADDKKVASMQDTFITIDDVVKVELCAGTIEICDPVEGSDKLYKLSVNFGDKGVRQILAGVRKCLTPENLLGKQGVFVVNLKPRSMMGLESHGMMLLAKTADGGFSMATVASPVPNGSRLG